MTVFSDFFKRAGYAFFIVHCALSILFSSCQSKEETDRQKYISEGIALYKNNCANCHQADGAGLAGLYPPLAGSDYLKANKNAVICSIKYGQQGPIVVNGKRYNRVMPAQLGLSTLEVAEITTYIYHKWGGDEKGMITAKEVQPILDECSISSQRRTVR
ncbi:c-type cytochrome [Fibrella rubiginis]|uniref:c-type cytochrome n=1 Tax=Fibrella rubiginis TaxID=2817060 RepID=UPI001E378B1C|nr:cytochrome c [Fibrella rubiginis]